MRYLLIICLLLTQSVAWGCSSYESCMSESDKYILQDLGKESMAPEKVLVFLETAHILINKAIAYKLDEISKKLDNLPPPDPFRQMAMKAVSKRGSSTKAIVYDDDVK